MVRLTDPWCPARELAYTTACIYFSFCASLVSASVSVRLGKASIAPSCNRASPRPPSLASHWRVSCLVESYNLNLIPRAFCPLPRPPKGPGNEVDRTSDWARGDQLLDLVERFVVGVGTPPICCLGRQLSDNRSRNVARWRRIYRLAALP